MAAQLEITVIMHARLLSSTPPHQYTIFACIAPGAWLVGGDADVILAKTWNFCAAKNLPWIKADVTL